MIETERLLLRDVQLDDFESFKKLCSDDQVTKYLDYITFATEEKLKEWVESHVKYNLQVPRHSYNFSIIEKTSGKFVGWIGIGEPSDKTKADLDFGYALMHDCWGKGYATEALRTLIKYCFDNLGVRRIMGDCDSRNIASQRVMEKVGMKLERKVQNGEKEDWVYVIEG